MSRNVYLISYDTNFENGRKDQLYTSVILVLPSWKRVEKKTNSAIELRKFRCKIQIYVTRSQYYIIPVLLFSTKVIQNKLHTIIKEAKWKCTFRSKKWSNSGLKFQIKNALNDNNAKVYILYRIIQGNISTRHVFVRVVLRIFIARHKPYSPFKRDCHKEIQAKTLVNIFQKQIISYPVKCCNFHDDNFKSTEYLNTK